MADIKASSTGGNLQTQKLDNWCDKMSTWCWPCPPKHFCGPSKYMIDTISKIPTGSLYFASRKGPVSESSARITGSPYDMIGIIFQSITGGREGIYVYTVDSTFGDGDDPTNKVVIVNLADLIKDDTIIHHAVLPLKDFADCDDEDGKSEESYQRRKRYGPVSYRSNTEQCKGHDGSDDDNDDNWYKDCPDSKEWKKLLRQKRTDIIKELFRKYRQMKPVHDAYQSLASIVGFPVAESLRSENAFTAPELIGLILFQAGLIWDGRFATGNKNPVCCFDKCFFQKLAEDCAKKDHDCEAIVALTTPRTHVSVKYSDHYTVREDKRKDYPNIICKEAHKKCPNPDCKCNPCKCDPCECGKKEAPKKEAPKKEAPKKEAPKKEAPKKEAPKKEAPKKEAPKKCPNPDCKCDPCECGKKEKETVKKDWLEDGIIEARQVYHRDDDNEEDESDRRVQNNLRRYLDEAFDNGYHSEYKDAQNEEKGSEEESGYCDYYDCEEENYKRCYYPAKWAKSVDCYDRGNNCWPKPCEKCVYARTILFGSLRPVDFLIDYYQSSGIDPNGHADFKDYTPLTGRRGAIGELVAIIHSLASQRAVGNFLDHNINKLNLCWYHDNLIPIELCNYPNRNCDDRIEHECKILKELVCRLDKDFVQKRMLHVDNTCLSGNRLHLICKRTSELSLELHALANECNTFVKYGKKYCHVNSYDENDEDRGEYKFKVLIDGGDKCATEYVIVLHEYMWGKGWSYDWKEALCRSQQKHYELCHRIKTLISDLVDLKNRTPISCIILDLIVCLVEQAHRLYRYVCNCRKYCQEEERRLRNYHERKGDDIDTNQIIDEICEE